MIYFEPSSLGWKVLLESWIYGDMNKNWHLDGADKFLYDMAVFLLSPTMRFVSKNCKELIKTNESNICK